MRINTAIVQHPEDVRITKTGSRRAGPKTGSRRIDAGPKTGRINAGPKPGSSRQPALARPREPTGAQRQ